MIGIVDYGAGNIRSVKNALSFCGAKFELVSEPENLLKCDKILLPGVGAFGEAMAKLKSANLDEAIREFVASGRYFLGICLGMQLLFDKSEEFGSSAGLGIISGEVVKFDESKFSESLKIPHMGWNTLEFTRETPINSGLESSVYAYFVHSYHALCDEEFILAKTAYGYEFPSAVCKENVFGFQPHPEKSHENGIKIIKNFTEL
ncbi:MULTISPECIES: imidazole glycerol phosphate synthase subunit HisH [unclassified Campylobacter]|uniref:imidazole glycerol phosphate synthase subunit HisH n=1 Tax=unclassified Campylobacter TaxID=2593542 RepID=UPI0022E9DCA4|nr:MULTISPECIES: imidazole glycerol phosphate synthase subunit HisH [unclassified Campylobacter]MDA3042892.1 imidazole glycerol phosphate synthase subunit HisH [Campylobacter sp. JMF_09 ED2]MDA3044273.1 imidazole glycerol phosphate synthase subunit HisH [Campylobacter sp. JMF_07 ED4]MDA3063622.1 imidazole glycerol phosphate synthase subunit HisH [Campylobacter sp. JMF_11 EL3]MDA3071248.1 imidazole glycerol phosphate synthase subunit HisH [Campylobacter sp. VBCF_03 NA9]MDA3074708.1 imidazole gl